MEYQIIKNDSPIHSDCGKWSIIKYKKVGTILEPVGKIFTADTRKECKVYANTNGINISYIDSGRNHGCRW